MKNYEAEMPTMVRSELATLTDEQRQAFMEEYARRRKSAGWAWPLWLIGWHIGYIEGRWGFNVVYVLASGPTLGIWWLIEAFKVNKRLRDQRAGVAIAALRDLRGIAVPVPAVAATG